MLTLLLVTLVVVSVFGFEYWWHRRACQQIPVRIHVNGIRGKSSVVRLIAAGLRAGGIRTWAKVTGTVPNLVDESGSDIPIIRGSPPSIIEQRSVVAEASAVGVQALVLECMALEPAFQRAERSMIRPTISVITNVRLDHEEVFGSSLLDIALGLSNTVPFRGVLVTTEGAGLRVLQRTAADRSTSVVVVPTQHLPDSLVDGFSYVEHKENVALALAVCKEAGVPPEVALPAMRSCIGDPGALRVLQRTREGKSLTFVNAMAANDPQSTLIVFERTVVAGRFAGPVLVLANSRKDRPLRSRQMGKLLPRIPAQRYLLIGDGSEALRDKAIGAGVSADAVEILQASDAGGVLDRLYEVVETEGLVFAIGNTAGLGLKIWEQFAGVGAHESGRVGA